MGFDRESNIYTLTFATIMVVLVGGLLAYVSMSLGPAQSANISNEKMQNILQAIGISETKGIQREQAGKVFNDYIKRRITIDYQGNILSDKKSTDPISATDKLDAFNIDLRKEYSKFIKPIMNQHKGNPEATKEALSKSKDIHFPIFVCEFNGATYYVLAASGKGLWDDVWGYIGLNSDLVTINGAVFDHKGETPGLGSKIVEPWFQEEFIKKKISDGTKFVPLRVIKPGSHEPNEFEVDGISGATFTGVGVGEMLIRTIEVYYNFFKSHPEFSGTTTVVATATDSTDAASGATAAVASDTTSAK